MVTYRRQEQQRIGQTIARKRLLEQAQLCSRPQRTHRNGAVLAYHGIAHGDVTLTGESPSYTNCAFLNAYDTLLAVTVLGEMDILQLPRYSYNNNSSSDNNNNNNSSSSNNNSSASGESITRLAGRIKVMRNYDPSQVTHNPIQESQITNNYASDHDCGSFRLSTRFKLQSLHQGQAFCVGTPLGELLIFATERASTETTTAWSQLSSRCSGWQASVISQESLSGFVANNLQQQQQQQQQQQLLLRRGLIQWRSPFVTHFWRSNLCCLAHRQQQQQQQQQQQHSLLAQRNHNWWITPRADALWDIREHASGSSVLAVHAKPNFGGCPRHVIVQDSRLSVSTSTIQAAVASLDLHGNTFDKTKRPRGITAVCLASEYGLVTAVAQPLKNRQVASSLQLWDLRHLNQAVWEVAVQDPLLTTAEATATANTAAVATSRRIPPVASIRSHRYHHTQQLPTSSCNANGSHFISLLTACKSPRRNGQVMITSSSYQNRSTVQHYWFDLNRQETVVEDAHLLPASSSTTGIESSFVQQRNRNTTVFDINAAHDFMACYDFKGTGIVRLFDWNYSSKTTPNAKQRPKRTMKYTYYHQNTASNTGRKRFPRKRSYEQQDHDTNDQKPAAILRRNISESLSNSSSSDNDSGSYGGSSDEESQGSESDRELSTSPFQYQGMKCNGSYNPKLSDQYGLSTRLSCLAVNDSGTVVAGGSHDGAVFAWRGV